MEPPSFPVSCRSIVILAVCSISLAGIYKSNVSLNGTYDVTNYRYLDRNQWHDEAINRESATHTSTGHTSIRPKNSIVGTDWTSSHAPTSTFQVHPIETQHGSTELLRDGLNTRLDKQNETMLIPLHTETLPSKGPYDNEKLPHPHAGARYPNGTMGYIADPTALRRSIHEFLQYQYPDEVDPISNASHYWDLLTNYYPEYRNGSLYGNVHLGASYVCNLGPGQGLEDDGGYKLLTEKITVSPSTPRPVLVLCATFTYRKMRELSRAQALSWGHKCDGYLAFSTETIPTLGLVEILHAGDEMYNNMWQKTRSIWAYIHDYFLNDFDFFHLGGDDLYVIVENLRRFLGRVHAETNETVPLFLGQWINSPGTTFVAGAPGYTLNRAALREFVKHALPTCNVNTKVSAEDRIISKCFRTTLNVTPGDTRDILTGEQQYHDCNPHHLYTFRSSKEKSSFHSKAAWAWEQLPHPLIPNVTVGPKHELEGAAKYSVALHDIYHPVFFARIHSLLHKDTCPSTSVLGQALQAHGFVS